MIVEVGSIGVNIINTWRLIHCVACTETQPVNMVLKCVHWASREEEEI